jgi:hypothetical protein
MAAAAAAKKKRAGDSMMGIPVQLSYPLPMTTDARALSVAAGTDGFRSKIRSSFVV